MERRVAAERGRYLAHVASVSDAFGEQVALHTRAERRDEPARQQLLGRLIAELDALGDVSITRAQICRWFALDHAQCIRLIQEVVQRGSIVEVGGDVFRWRSLGSG